MALSTEQKTKVLSMTHKCGCGQNMLMHSLKSNVLSSMSHKRNVNLKSLSALKITLLTEFFLIL